MIKITENMYEDFRNKVEDESYHVDTQWFNTHFAVIYRIPVEELNNISVPFWVHIMEMRKAGNKHGESDDIEMYVVIHFGEYLHSWDMMMQTEIVDFSPNHSHIEQHYKMRELENQIKKEGK